jgi:heme oxygenase (biliverdin-IX-beta and delta-forming)
MNIVTGTFLDNLRSSTQESHKKLESLPLSAAIVSEKLSISDYSLYLQRMSDIIHQTEEVVFPKLQDIIPDLEERKKLPLLSSDFNTLNVSKTAFKKPFHLGNHSVAFALGIMYVVEGSTLGGRFIMRNVGSALGFDENNGACYFAGYGNKSGNYWKNFLAALTQYEQENNCADEILAGADFAFTEIYTHLSNPSYA